METAMVIAMVIAMAPGRRVAIMIPRFRATDAKRIKLEKPYTYDNPSKLMVASTEGESSHHLCQYLIIFYVWPFSC